MRKSAAFMGMIALVLGLGLEPGVRVTAAAAEQIPGTAIKALFPGTFEGVWKGKHELVIGAKANGKLSGFADGKYDEGRWEVDGDRLCVSFEVWTDGDRKCGELYRNGSWYVGLVDDGEPRLRFRKK